LILLVLGCPCAIVIATPIPSVSAIAIAAKHGNKIGVDYDKIIVEK